nr:hypothetical protein Y848_p0040 [Clostridium botulinum C/D str. Sp77]
MGKSYFNMSYQASITSSKTLVFKQVFYLIAKNIVDKYSINIKFKYIRESNLMGGLY